LKEDGFGCFVVPKNFLLSDNAAPLRAELLERAHIRCVVDLSAVRVFEDVGVYVILLIFQKSSRPNPKFAVLSVQCNDLVGLALEDALQERETRTSSYQVYWSTQPQKSDPNWSFPPPEKVSIQSRFAGLPKLGDVAEVRQGVITGADSIFIVSAAEVPRSEKDIYAPFLNDREIEPYVVPKQVSRYVIHPYDKKGILDENRLSVEYPITWNYLLSKHAQLSSRKSATGGKVPWWRPAWPRERDKLLIPKIITPHIVIAPRFAWDHSGRFAISHSPYIVPKSPGGRDEALFLLAVLNSTACFWAISQNAHSYSRGYSRLEVTTLKSTPVPDLSLFDNQLFRDIVSLTEQRMEAVGNDARALDAQLDIKVAEAYGLNESEKRVVGLGFSV
jgi:hypothetical protein